MCVLVTKILRFTFGAVVIRPIFKSVARAQSSVTEVYGLTNMAKSVSNEKRLGRPPGVILSDTRHRR